MEEIVYNAISLLFKDFWQYGNFNEEEIFKILAVIVIRDMLLFDDCFLKECEIKEIEKAINKLLGESCQLSLRINEQDCCEV